MEPEQKWIFLVAAIICWVLSFSLLIFIVPALVFTMLIIGKKEKRF